jgi:hypothetical protein
MEEEQLGSNKYIIGVHTKTVSKNPIREHFSSIISVH